MVFGGGTPYFVFHKHHPFGEIHYLQVLARPGSWRHYVPPKDCYPATRLYCVTSPETSSTLCHYRNNLTHLFCVSFLLQFNQFLTLTVTLPQLESVLTGSYPLDTAVMSEIVDIVAVCFHRTRQSTARVTSFI